MARGGIAAVAEYAALRGACGVVNVVPYAAIVPIVRGLSWVVCDVFRFKRARTLGRIASVFPEKTPRECRAIARDSFASFILFAVELIRSPRFDAAWMDRHVVGGRAGLEVMKPLMAEGRGAVIMVPHTGNWCMPAWALGRYGLSIFALGARQRNPYIHAWLYRHYGMEVLDRDDRRTLVKIRDGLREGRAFAIMPDLRVRRKDVTADFLGGQANVSHAGAMFAIKGNAPIVLAAMRRDGTRHVLEHLATLRPEGRTAEDLTREALAILDRFVRRHPGDWYWYNKRWILEPVTEG